jgi:bifunctional non-homologous end joining protein LigD
MPRFVIHEHHARRLHYDFRLEMDAEGCAPRDRVLKSWAVPKEPTMEPKVKRLAIEVEDHALDYIDFEGTVEEGKYGAGTVRIWDSGEYTLISREEGLLRFELHGQRLTGPFKLVHMTWPPGNQWLLMRGRVKKTS